LIGAVLLGTVPALEAQAYKRSYYDFTFRPNFGPPSQFAFRPPNYRFRPDYNFDFPQPAPPADLSRLPKDKLVETDLYLAPKEGEKEKKRLYNYLVNYQMMIYSVQTELFVEEANKIQVEISSCPP
jgi:hypothetical protein